MKISTIPPKTPALDAVDKVKDAAEATSAAAVSQTASAVASDPVAKIAAEVAAGKIGQKEAVDRILADVLDGPMLQAVPESVRNDLENALRVLIEEDPHLRSLAAAVGPTDVK